MITFPVGEDGTPNIRPLETLHNALSLRQVDGFLEQITNANYKTPTLSPKLETPPGSGPLSLGAAAAEHTDMDTES